MRSSAPPLGRPVAVAGRLSAHTHPALPVGPNGERSSPWAPTPPPSGANDGLLEGWAPWDPTDRSLKRHLYNVVKRKISANRERAERLPHVSIDAITAEGHSPLRDELRYRASRDADVLALIEAKADERTSRADAMKVTGFSKQRYRAAARRLNRIANELRIDVELVSRSGYSCSQDRCHFATGELMPCRSGVARSRISELR